MLQSGDVRVSLSSIEFSLLYPSHQTPRYCPSCGFYLPTVTFGEIASRYIRESYFRLSSVILILGVGSFICYKLFMHRRRKRKKSLTSCIAYSFGGLLSRDKSCGSFDSFHEDPPYFIESPSTPPSPNSLICESMDADFDTYLAQSLEKYLIRKSSSPSPLSIEPPAPEDRTIAKLDQLLQQIEEIKESVGELNLDFVEIRKLGLQPIKERPEADSLTPNTDEISSLVTKEELSTPSLEWDSNDVAFFSEYGELGDYDSIPDSAELAANMRSFKSFSSTSGVSTFSASDTASQVSHYGDNQEVSRLRLIQNLIDEARRLGILPDLMKLLLRNSTRDSAFFED